MHRENLGRSALKAFGAQRLLEPRCESIVRLAALPHGNGEEVVILADSGVEQKAWGSGIGDPSAQLALYFSALNAGGRYTTAIAIAYLLVRSRAYAADLAVVTVPA
jgi:hypothetical protein